MTTTTITTRTRAVPAAAKRPGLPGTLRSELTKILLGPLHLLDAAGLCGSKHRLGGPGLRGHCLARSRPELQRSGSEPDGSGRPRRADHRGARRAGHHLGVLHRDDPHLAGGDAASQRAVCGQGDRVRRRHADHLPGQQFHRLLRRAGHPVRQALQHHTDPARRAACGTAVGGDCHRVRAVRVRRRRDHPEHRGGDQLDPRVDLPDPAAGPSPAERLVCGPATVAARRRGAEPIARSTPPIDGHLFSAWGEFAVFSGYAVVLLAVGAWLFIRRDA